MDSRRNRDALDGCCVVGVLFAIPLLVGVAAWMQAGSFLTGVWWWTATWCAECLLILFYSVTMPPD